MRERQAATVGTPRTPHATTHNTTERDKARHHGRDNNFNSCKIFVIVKINRATRFRVRIVRRICCVRVSKENYVVARRVQTDEGARKYLAFPRFREFDVKYLSHIYNNYSYYICVNSVLQGFFTLFFAIFPRF
jgi:hypothetical protein